MKQDDCVLIGSDYRDLVGGAGSYDFLLEIFEEVGTQTRDQLENFGQ